MGTTVLTPALEDYVGLADEELDNRIACAKAALGPRLVILGHHYQRDEVIKFADYTGDSLKLSQQAAHRKEAEYIVFCGVHFMAESADILRSEGQVVILPDQHAGCSMADMADLDQVEVCWEELARSTPAKIVPITYINSTAAIKAFVGRRDGAVCTSSNARKIMEWALARGEKGLFLPDEHLGRNTAYNLGIPLAQIEVWDPHQEMGGLVPSGPAATGLNADQISKARVILWKGHCSVHQRFLPQHVAKIRREIPGVRVIAHPECSWEVCQLADETGSTEFIIKRIGESPPGSAWAVGTEIHLVNRLARQFPNRRIVSLDDCGCLCSTMYRISPQHLCWVLESLVAGNVVGQIRVEEETRRWARLALDRMLEIH